MAAIAARQHGVVSRAQLRAALGQATVDRWVRAGRLVRLHRGVYAYGHAALTGDGRWMAAVLACGERSTLGVRSAGASWALLTTSRTRVDVIVRGAAGRGLDLVDAHRFRLHPSERTERNGIPITTPMRTLVDLAAVERPHRLARAVEAAERLRLLDLAEIDAILARAPRRRGARALREALRAHRPEHAWTRSGVERAAVALIERHGLPRPRVNAVVDGHEVDLCWPAERLVAELDTPDFHGTRAAFERDRARDAQLTAARWRVIRLTGERLRQEPEAVAAQLRALLRPPGGPTAPGRASPRRRTPGRHRPAGRTPAGSP
ncbi:MAG TPA: type IV toxin-antitoxin system AbiEi family antitoxin domain-containing protein [Capillimicrobium sp.]